MTAFTVRNQLHYIEEDLLEKWVDALVELCLSWFPYWKA